MTTGHDSRGSASATMSSASEWFQFNDSQPPADARVVKVRSGVHKKRTLLGVLARGLGFPAYFGWNWDALNDCLTTLDGVTETTIVLRHRDVPGVVGSNLRRTYLEVLKDAVASWKSEPGRKFLVQFPPHCLPAVEAALRSV